MGDRIFIDNLRVKSKTGITEAERREPQEVLLDVSLYVSTRAAGASDDVRDSLDYWVAVKRISDFVSNGEFGLLESMAERLAGLLLEEFPIEKVSVRIRKAKFAGEPSIGVEIVRERG
jgi:7,8-dihydroneopterin aldolase/epimerase/oxygenase